MKAAFYTALLVLAALVGVPIAFIGWLYYLNVVAEYFFPTIL